ncbi:MAG: hypothetical protein NDF56_06700 [archaeon GB-1845-036]|nr:hypothetical protein [Candidatus Verstraetearchaeota archaeon]MCS7374649.1 hypothetical protein [Candidatus Culexmicrobium thermophilum]
MFTIHIFNVKNWFNFIDRFGKFIGGRDFEEAVKAKNIHLSMRYHGTLLLEIDGVYSVGDFESWNILSDKGSIGSLNVCYMDQHFFSLSVEAIDALLSDEELKTLMLSGPSWATPIGPVELSLNFNPSDKVKDLIKNFINGYHDDYPNEIARKFAPRAKIR